MTTEQKAMLEEILKALHIDLDDFLLVSNMRNYDESIKNCEKMVSKFHENLIQLNNRIADVENKVTQIEADSVLGVLRQDED